MAAELEPQIPTVLAGYEKVPEYNQPLADLELDKNGNIIGVNTAGKIGVVPSGVGKLYNNQGQLHFQVAEQLKNMSGVESVEILTLPDESEIFYAVVSQGESKVVRMFNQAAASLVAGEEMTYIDIPLPAGVAPTSVQLIPVDEDGQQNGMMILGKNTQGDSVAVYNFLGTNNVEAGLIGPDGNPVNVKESTYLGQNAEGTQVLFLGEDNSLYQGSFNGSGFNQGVVQLTPLADVYSAFGLNDNEDIIDISFNPTTGILVLMQPNKITEVKLNAAGQFDLTGEVLDTEPLAKGLLSMAYLTQDLEQDILC